MLRKKYQNISHFCFWLAILGAAQLDAQLPTGASIASGAASIQQSGSAMTIQQSSQKAALNWASFNIGAGNSVNFIQPNASSVALNRVLGNDASSIFGSLQANGSVFLLNPNGVLFAPGAQINVGGLVASTLSLSDADFAAGNYLFTNSGNAGSVVNQGHIQAGNVALLGPQIINSGIIDASGSVALAAGDAITVKLLDSGLLTAHVDKAALRASIQNHGQIYANGGQVQLLADAIQDSLINTDGLIQAKSLVNKEGHIYLSGGSNGTVTVSGTLDASGGEVGAQGGEISVLGKQVGLMAGAKLDASADAGGGTVLAGDNWHGQGPEQNASATYMDANASIHADATGTGNGGQVVLWSNDYTGFYGNISAKGGLLGGAGGNVETSSHNNLQAFGLVDTAAAAGRAGTWLLDPADVTIVSGSANTNDTDAGGIWTPTTNTAQIGVTNINNDLNAGTSVTINTASAGAGTGNITQNSGATISKTAGGNASLTMNAAGSITLGDSVTSSAGQLAVTLNANGGAVSGSGPGINTNGGLLTVNAASGSGTLSGVISGTGGLLKGGAGTLTLSGNNSYSGGTTVSNGTLQTASSYGAGFGTVTLGDTNTGSGNVAWRIAGFNEPLNNIVVSSSGTGTVTLGGYTAGINTEYHGNVQLNRDVIIQDGTGDRTTFSVGAISGTGNITVSGSRVTFAGSNTDTGVITINPGTMFQIDGDGAASSNSSIVNNGSLWLNSNNPAIQALNGSGNTRAVTGGAKNLTVGLNNAAGSYSGVISDGAAVVSITKVGTGTQLLSGANTYSGTTTVNAGTLAVANPSALGDTSGGTTVSAGATLDLQNVAVGPESVTLAGGSSAYGTLLTSTGTSSLSGPITLSGPSYSFFSVAAGSQLTLSGVISGTGGIEKPASDPGTLVLAGANTYTGQTQLDLSAGTVAITNDSALGSTSGSTNLRTGSTLELRNVTIAEPITPNGGTILASTGVSTILSNMGTFASLPVNVLDGVQLTIAGVIGAGASLTKNGNGTLTLTGNNTNAGATTINAGTLQVGSGGTMGKFGTGAVTVASGANLVFNRSDGVNLSTLASNAAGITGQGNVSALIGGGFTVDRPIALTGANSSILLEAGKNQLAGDTSGGDVTLNRPVSTSATGTVTIFSGNANTAVLDAQVSGATGGTRYKTYGSGSSTSSAVAGTRNYYYRQNPGAFTVSGLTATKTYDGLVDAASVLNGGAATVTGIDGDTPSYSSLGLTGASFDSAHAGSRNLTAAFNVGPFSYTSGATTWSVSGYSPTSTGSGSGTITPKALGTSINAVSKTYDGLTTTASTLTAPTGLVGSDSATGVSGFLLAFDNPNAGTRNIAASGTGTLAGFNGAARGNGSGIGAGSEVAGLASDYSIPTPSPVSAVISQAALTITANNDAKIVTQSDTPGYNGASFSGFVHGETEANLGGSLSITRSNTGTEGAGNYAGVLVPSGQSSSNYAISYANGNYQILPAQQLLIKLQNVTNPYGTSPGYAVSSVEYLDGSGTVFHALTETAHSANTYTYSDGIGGSVTFTITPQGTVTSNAGYLAVGNYPLSGSNASITGNNFLGLNYVGNQSVRQIGLTLLADGTSKVYDGTTAIPSLSMDVVGKLASDVALASGDGAFRTKNAGSNLGYDVNNITLSGADAGNYYLATGGFSGTNGVITPRTITANVTANNKVYDGSTAATLTAAGLNGVIAGDTLALDAANYSAFFSDRNVGSNKAVTLSGLGLSGADAGNYTLNQPSGLTADITPRQLTVTAVENTKTYDGTTQAATAPQVSGGLVDGDRFTMLAENYTSANAGTDRALMPVISIDDGNGGNNYTLTLNNGSGMINQASLLLVPNAVRVPYTGLALNNTVYSDLLSNYTLTGLLGGDTLSSIGLSLTGSMAFNGSTTALVQNPGAYLFGAGTLSPSLTSTNYTIAFANPSGNAYTILPGLDPYLMAAGTIVSSDSSNIRMQTNAAQQQFDPNPSEPKCLLALEGGSMKLPSGLSDSQEQQQRACRGNQ